MNELSERRAASSLGGRDDYESLVDGLVDVMLTILVFGKGKSAAPLAGRRLRNGVSSLNVGASFRDSYLFELACYVMYAIDAWHAERGMLRLRDRVFRAAVLPRFFSVFELPGRVAHLERLVVHRLRTYDELRRIDSSEIPLCFAEFVLKSVVHDARPSELGGPDFWFLSEHMVASMATISDLAEFAATRLPLFLASFESFYRRLPERWTLESRMSRGDSLVDEPIPDAELGE